MGLVISSQLCFAAAVQDCYKNGKTSIEVIVCLDELAQNAESAMNSVVNSIRAKLKSLPSLKSEQQIARSFETSQQAFLLYRATNCKWYSIQESGDANNAGDTSHNDANLVPPANGSNQDLSAASVNNASKECAIKMTEIRTQELQKWLSDHGAIVTNTTNTTNINPSATAASQSTADQSAANQSAASQSTADQSAASQSAPATPNTSGQAFVTQSHPNDNGQSSAK